VSKEKCQRKTGSSILTGSKPVSWEVASNIISEGVFIYRGLTARNTRKRRRNTKEILARHFEIIEG